jgi:2-succinyl-5-enolpyruvyl-6-hydroxy-3-cyclohexene-1-carboxylate synthase
MSAPDVTTSFAVTLVDEWARAGVTHAVVSPGSRNTPLLFALARDGRIAVEVVVDERSAGFRAVGLGLATGRPALVCCTSGTAAANLHPAVVEAHHARVPLIVCTADRPPELRDCGAGQTIDQARLFGTSVRWFHDPGPPDAHDGAPHEWRALAGRAFAIATGSPAGPVHLNVPFREPLVPTGAPLVDAAGRAGGEPWVRTTRGERQLDFDEVAAVARLVRAHPHGVVVAGWGTEVDADTVQRLAAVTGWPVLADPVSNARTGPHAISTYEALLRDDGFAAAHRPSLALRIGAPLTSRVANAWLAGVPHVVVDPDDSWLDPDRLAAHRIVAEPTRALAAIADAFGEPAAPTGWLEGWTAAEREVRIAIDKSLDADEHMIEGRIARDLLRAMPDGSACAVASSLPVRALEWCMAPRSGVRVFANRGANGIDGFVSTALGIAQGVAPRRTVALCGDLCFLHDTNGLLGSSGTRNLTFVVIDNDGGGIFSYLPQQGLPDFERLFATPHGLDLVAVARAHGVSAERITDPGDWPALLADGPRVVVVPVDRSESVAGHRRLWETAASVLRTGDRVASVG